MGEFSGIFRAGNLGCVIYCVVWVFLYNVWKKSNFFGQPNIFLDTRAYSFVKNPRNVHYKA